MTIAKWTDSALNMEAYPVHHFFSCNDISSFLILGGRITGFPKYDGLIVPITGAILFSRTSGSSMSPCNKRKQFLNICSCLWTYLYHLSFHNVSVKSSNKLTPWSIVILKNLIVIQLVYKLPTFNPSLRLVLNSKSCPGWRRPDICRSSNSFTKLRCSEAGSVWRVKCRYIAPRPALKR